MGKKKRRMTSQKFAKKFAAKFAKFRAALEEAAAVVVDTYEEVASEREIAPEVVVNEVDESVTVEPKPKKRSRKISPRKKSSDSKKKPAKKKTTKRKPAKKK